MNIAQDFSPATASGLNGLVPEARLSRCFTDQFACLSGWFSHSLAEGSVQPLQRSNFKSEDTRAHKPRSVSEVVYHD